MAKKHDIDTDTVCEMAFTDITKAYLHAGFTMADLEVTLADALSQTELVDSPLTRVKVSIEIVDA